MSAIITARPGHSNTGVFEGNFAPLGTILPSVSTFTGPKPDFLSKYHKVTSARKALQNVIRNALLRRADLPDKSLDEDGYFDALNGLPRIVKCERSRFAADVTLHRSLTGTHRRAHFGGLVTCNSVWTCPVCAPRIAEARRVEIAQAFAWAYSREQNLKAIMVTFTLPHYIFHSCAELIQGFTEAQRKMKSHRQWRELRKDIGYSGLIRALEVKYGSNGWHPHSHELIFVNPAADTSEIQRRVISMWERSCRSLGLIPRGKIRDFRHWSVDVIDNVKCSEYMTKTGHQWGGDLELTKSLSKYSGSSYHPFSLAELIAEGNTVAEDLFFEYAEAFRGRAAIFWSPHFREAVGLGTLDDDYVPDPFESEVICVIGANTWCSVLRLELRADLLAACAHYGLSGVVNLLAAHGLHADGIYGELL